MKILSRGLIAPGLKMISTSDRLFECVCHQPESMDHLKCLVLILPVGWLPIWFPQKKNWGEVNRLWVVVVVVRGGGGG